jgi:hypothetical protein
MANCDMQNGLNIYTKKKWEVSPHFPERQIQATDQQIDQLVYELYGLTEKEIKIIKEKWE